MLDGAAKEGHIFPNKPPYPIIDPLFTHSGFPAYLEVIQEYLSEKEEHFCRIISTHGRTMIRLAMHALHEPERIRAASERDSTPTICAGSPA